MAETHRVQRERHVLKSYVCHIITANTCWHFIPLSPGSGRKQSCHKCSALYGSASFNRSVAGLCVAHPSPHWLCVPAHGAFRQCGCSAAEGVHGWVASGGKEPELAVLAAPGSMDVGELLSYQPNRGTKRPRDDEEEELKMRRKQAGTRERGRFREEEMTVVEEADDDKKRLLQIIDREGEEEEEEEEPLDESSVKKMILTFEKRSYKNQELRIKFPDNPEKFMESELDLNDIIQEMHVVATMPDLYHLLVELNAVQSLLGLLGHDNTDILSDLSSELTDIDTLHESEEGAEVLIDALVDGQVVALLVQNLERLDESVKEEADGVHNTLAIVENMAEFRPEMCTEAAQQGLLQWLLKRLKAKMPFDANKLYCSEVLAILLQDNDENRELLGELDGIDVLLQQLSVFKRHNPSTAEEQEMMENLFDSLCSCLMLSSNRERFLKGEGLQLMNLMLREKKISRSSALKVLDHAMIGPEGTDNCHKFVDILGLRTIFPLFMKSPKKIKKVGTTEKEHEAKCCHELRCCNQSSYR
ncbi:Beta-catenin-like protein 1 [Myotis brandtii]|uniref:Beta-catenin-like protein 1 n=1 Tax=Myotis brandtii TaxID=109478 RepID=S7MEH2_MYOBR|nr:Beta-catenin-like protein 1 [Myotis brandtii]